MSDDVATAPAVTLTVTDGLAILTLDRPDSRNAIDTVLIGAVHDAATAVAADRGVRAVLVRANGPAFTVGGDVTSFSGLPSGKLGAFLADMVEPYHEAIRTLDGLEVPVVTATHGAVAGGGLGLVFVADVVIAADDTVFRTAFGTLGLSGDSGGTWYLPRLVGQRRAAQMYLQNLPVGAELAREWGLVTDVVPAAELRDRSTAVATALAAGPTRALGAQRRLLRRSSASTLDEHLQAEADALRATGDTDDASRAVSAFLAKSRPTFQGR